ncbi:tetratricopeptide repeat protein [Vicingaceae bacterium]|nr:tetratricopeptide repeat protein [Vicingaceae bacterium]
MKLYTPLILLTVIFSLLKSDDCNAQNFADKEYYLIDSLLLDDLSEADRFLIDSCLNIYHTAKQDTDKVNMLFVWYNAISYIEPATSYKLLNQIELLSSNNLKKRLSTSEKVFFLKSLSTAVNDKGFYLAEIFGDLDGAAVLFLKSLSIEKEINDSLSLATAFNNIGYVYDIGGEIDSAIFYYEKSLNILEKIELSTTLSTCLRNLSGLYYYRGDEDIALEYTKRSLKIAKKIGDENEIASCYMYYADYYIDKGNMELALNYSFEALNIVEETENKELLSDVLANIGSIHAQYLSDYNAGLVYFKRSLEISEKIGYKDGISTNINNIGFVYDNLGDKKKALVYYKKSLLIDENSENVSASISSIRNIGALYEDLGEEEEAMIYYNKSLKLSEDIENNISIASSLNNISSLYLKRGDIKKAKESVLRAYKIANDYEHTDLIRLTSFRLSNIYKSEKNWMKAFEMYQISITARDRINNLETQKEIIKKQTKYEYEKKKVIDDVENEKVVAVEKEAKKKQEVISYAVTGGLALTGVFLFFVFNRLRVTRKQKLIIEGQKEEVEVQKNEAEIQRDIANNQKLIVEIKNKEITESITYAKRIQEAILPPPRLVKEWLTESFIFYKPKDIVAGDFYWMETATFNENNKEKTLVYFAAADCTGHGVPGAMVSVVCANALNRAIKEFNLIEPGQVLDKVTELVVESFDKGDEDIKDGMDIALCALDISAKKVFYSGANNPLYRITSIKEKVADDIRTENNETHQLIEYKANKQPIGFNENHVSFNTIEIQLEPGDAIYVFSDGFPDQFGGAKGKKYKYSTFRKSLLANFHHPMETQKQMLETEFDNWKGELEQIDDVCVIGVRINGKEKNNFTKRELEVLIHLKEGLSSKLIADRMSISKHTVDTYRRRLLAKTGSYNATELISYCIKKEII